nr:hypothetical protein CFP56_66706 [Quercus suber]
MRDFSWYLLLILPVTNYRLNVPIVAALLLIFLTTWTSAQNLFPDNPTETRFTPELKQKASRYIIRICIKVSQTSQQLFNFANNITSNYYGMHDKLHNISHKLRAYSSLILQKLHQTMIESITNPKLYITKNTLY